ncbi:MAG: metallophosphoesterase, partial [Bacteroidales bacterium]|nr:metallophosphoesterase [Bacteroidales bacterium]
MLAKQILFVSLLIPFIEWFCYVAVRNAVSVKGLPYRKWIWLGYGLLTLYVVLSMVAFPVWSSTQWPSDFIRVLVNSGVGLFFGKVFVALIQAAGSLLSMLISIANVIIHALRRKNSTPVGQQTGNTAVISRSEFISRSALLFGGIVTAGLGYGMTNKYRYRIKQVQVKLQNLPRALRGLKIVQISDIHAGGLFDKEAVAAGIAMIEELKADLVLFTGDLVNYRAAEIEPFLDLFGRIKAPLGVFSILGNHDYGDYLNWSSETEKQADFERLLKYQRSMGWQVLRNEHRILSFNNCSFALIGVENWSTHHRFHKYGNLQKAMEGLDAMQLPLQILMSHDPSHWDAEVRPLYPGITLTLSGHTHGMQLGINTPRLKWSPSQYLYKQWAGLYTTGNQHLYVNTGFGSIGYDGRLG